METEQQMLERQLKQHQQLRAYHHENWNRMVEVCNALEQRLKAMTTRVTIEITQAELQELHTGYGQYAQHPLLGKLRAATQKGG